MSIYVDTANSKSVFVCNGCGETHETAKPDGVTPSDWMTGHLWLDVSLAEQRQVPIVWCASCAVTIKDEAMRPVVRAELD